MHSAACGQHLKSLAEDFVIIKTNVSKEVLIILLREVHSIDVTGIANLTENFEEKEKEESEVRRGLSRRGGLSTRGLVIRGCLLLKSAVEDFLTS